MSTQLMTEAEYNAWIEKAARQVSPPQPHPLCQQVRHLRKARKLSLAQFEEQSGIPAVVVGAYERGDRIPPLPKLEAIFQFFNYHIIALPANADATRLPTDMVAELRAIADQLEAVSGD